MSVLQVSNIHFESTGNNRLQYTGSNGYILVGGGSNVAIINTTAVDFPLDLVANNVAFSNISFEATGNNRIEYAGSNTWQFVAGGANVFTVNTTSAIFPDSISVTGAATFSNTVSVTGSTQTSAIGVNTTPPSAGEIRATGDITAFYSDERLKDIHGIIENSLRKIENLNGYHYTANKIAQDLGYDAEPQVGLSAQEVQKVLPEAVTKAPISYNENVNQDYLTVKYEKLIPLLVEAIKELKTEIEQLKK